MPKELSKNSYPPLSDSALKFCGDSCLLILKEMGLPRALTYLLAFLKQHYPITRIFCGFRHYKDMAFIPIADTLPEGIKTTQYLTGRSLTEEQIRKILVDDSRSYFFSEDPFPNGIHKIMRPEDFISHVRVPLFKLGEATFQIGFCSDTQGAFTDKDADYFQQLTRSFSLELERTLHLMLERNAPMPYEDSCGLLRMCNGLTELQENIARVAATDYTVLIEGETGVGKDIVADVIHRTSARCNGPLIKLNCGAISDSILESELFGHERNAFTGANSTHYGYFEAANGGTIFLDEIGELSLRAQVKLLRTIENREILRVGGTRCIPLDIRVIAATNRNLSHMVEEGNFREDLWYRINIFPLYVPPLRQRQVDIPVLVNLFVHEASARLGLISPPVIPFEEMERLYHYNWPGNVRELRNIIERAVVRNHSSAICQPLHFELPQNIGKKASTAVKAKNFKQDNELIEGTLPTLEEFGDRYVAWMLHHTNGKISGTNGAAELLGVHPNTVREHSRRNAHKST